MSSRHLRSIRWHAQRYLKSRTTSSGHLAMLLLRGARKRFPDAEVPVLRAKVDAVVAELLHTGAVNDRAWAESRIRALRRRGNSERQIRSKLREKRIPADLLDALLDAHREQTPDAELLAALDYLRKRRLGPWASAPDPQKTLGKLGRRGFSYETAGRALDMELDEALARLGR